MPDLVKIFKAIPFFKKLAQQKLIVFLFDFDQEGIDNLVKCIPKKSQEIFENIADKKHYLSKVEEDTNIYVSHLIPNNEHSWKLKNEYRHQELKKEGNYGIKRQFEHLKSIKDNK